jgi:hypothetical protein
MLFDTVFGLAFCPTSQTVWVSQQSAQGLQCLYGSTASSECDPNMEGRADAKAHPAQGYPEEQTGAYQEQTLKVSPTMSD